MIYKKNTFSLCCLLILVLATNSIAQVAKPINSNSTTMKNQVNNSNQNPVLVCKLTGKAFTERKKLLQKQVFSKVKKQEEISNGYVFYFAYNADFLIKLTDYIISENSCCPFLAFDISLLGKNDIKLKISGDPQVKKVIQGFLVK